jgi:hypothetical protein
MSHVENSKHIEKLEKELVDIHMKIILTADEEIQSELRTLYRDKQAMIKKQREWEEALNESIHKAVAR